VVAVSLANYLIYISNSKKGFDTKYDFKIIQV
jgi:hypothetical protein